MRSDLLQSKAIKAFKSKHKRRKKEKIVAETIFNPQKIFPLTFYFLLYFPMTKNYHFQKKNKTNEDVNCRNYDVFNKKNNPRTVIACKENC